ncbi:ConsensusA, partial [Halyomorpha halys]
MGTTVGQGGGYGSTVGEWCSVRGSVGYGGSGDNWSLDDGGGVSDGLDWNWNSPVDGHRLLDGVRLADHVDLGGADLNLR